MSTENSTAPATPYPASLGSPPTELSEVNDFSTSNDVAVVGLACRVAGGNNSAELLWSSIMAKHDASSEIPSWRWEPYLRRDSRNAEELKKTTSRGYFLDAIENFDAAFFGISPKEAEQMDPQQRLSLEVTWEALENAGINPKSLSGSDTAVYMGVNSDDYSKLLLEDLPNVDAWMGIGTAYCGVPNRISYHLNLMGPSVAVDAACASSLVAIHHGRQSILMGESKIAIVGGVNALVGPGLTRVLDKAGAVSPDGRCLSFDDSAHGYGRGEGAAVVILKRLRDAIEEGDDIKAVLKGSAVAQDGKTNGIMAPNAKAQEMVARQALEQANVDANTIEYVEAHATSTPLGDPTEVGAISAVYGYGANRSEPVAIGSVKPNVGHLEAGAGVVSFVKAVMAINKAQFPPQANLQKLNSKVDWEKSGVRVVMEASTWVEPHSHPRRAAICSYGYGGTVSHAVIEESSFINQSTIVASAPIGPILLVISAPKETRVLEQARSLADWLSTTQGKSQTLTSIANTLALRRAHHDYRATFVVYSHEQATEALLAFTAGKQSQDQQEACSKGVVVGLSTKRDVVWVFSGHGAQWKEMGKQLINSSPVFYEAIEPLDLITQAELGFSAIEALENGEFIDQSDRVQVMTYVIQIGIAAVLHSKGLYPSAVIGHSVGEIAATVVAGSLTPEEGALIVTKRAKLYGSVKGQGAMFLVNLPFGQVSSELGDGGDVVAAIDSSPSSCVISGELNAVEAYAKKLTNRGVNAMRVATDIAFHSYQMLNPLSVALRDALVDANIQPQSASVPLYSTSHIDPRYSGLRDADYWVHNMTNPVHLTSAIRAAASDDYRLFLEVSSHPIVAHSVNETLMDCEGVNDEEFSVVPTLRRGKSAETSVLQAIGSLFVKGAEVDFRTQLGRHWSPLVPGTQWAHQPIWRKVVSGVPLAATNLTHDVDTHSLLGLRSQIGGTDTILYTTKLDKSSKPFPGSHPLHGTEIVPAAGLINTFHHATKAATLSNITLRVPVAVDAPRDVQVIVAGDNVTIVSRLQREEDTHSDANPEDRVSWVTHTTGRWASVRDDKAKDELRIDIEATKARIKDVLPPKFSIEYLEKVGVSAMGFPWAITEHYGNLSEMLARVDVAPHLAADTVLPWDAASWAPILDAATSVGSTIFFDNPRLRMPAQIGKVQFFTEYATPVPKVGYLYVKEVSESKTTPAVDVSICDENGLILARFESMRFSEIEGTPGVSGSVESLVHRLAWVPAQLNTSAASWNSAVLVSDNSAVVADYRKQLSSKLKIQDEKISCFPTTRDAFSSAGQTITQDTVFIYRPGAVLSLAEVPVKSEVFISELLSLAKHVINSATSIRNVKVFVFTEAVATASTPTALAHAPLHGLARIIASEHAEQWGGLIDVGDEEESFPALAIKYVPDQDVIRLDDGLPRVARLQPLPRDLLYSTEEAKSQTLLPKPEGTYIITGGLGALGRKVARWLIEKGARRLILLSRRALPARRDWSKDGTENNRHLDVQDIIEEILELEQSGATIYPVALDIAAQDAQARLQETLDQLALPPVLGVVHAAGTVEDQLVLNTTADAFARVLAPKVSGALALHAVFPPGTLDWFVLFSSCGQLFGFPGQSSYASGNAFLDVLATHRRQQGDNAVAFQWTSWRGLGMAASTDFISAELQSKGITDITVEEGFRAWEHLGRYDLDHGVVLRSLAFDEGEPTPTPILEDIAVRRDRASAESEPSAREKTANDQPSGGPELKAWIDRKVREVVAAVLMLNTPDDVDGRAALADMGVDSVMTVSLRRNLQTALKIKVPPTLTWSHPTTNHLVGWFNEKLSSI